MTTDPLVPPLHEESTTTWHVEVLRRSGEWWRYPAPEATVEAARHGAKALLPLRVDLLATRVVRRTTTITEEIA